MNNKNKNKNKNNNDDNNNNNMSNEYKDRNEKRSNRQRYPDASPHMHHQLDRQHHNINMHRFQQDHHFRDEKHRHQFAMHNLDHPIQIEEALRPMRDRERDMMRDPFGNYFEHREDEEVEEEENIDQPIKKHIIAEYRNVFVVAGANDRSCYTDLVSLLENININASLLNFYVKASDQSVVNDFCYTIPIVNRSSRLDINMFSSESDDVHDEFKKECTTLSVSKIDRYLHCIALSETDQFNYELLNAKVPKLQRILNLKTKTAILISVMVASTDETWLDEKKKVVSAMIKENPALEKLSFIFIPAGPSPKLKGQSIDTDPDAILSINYNQIDVIRKEIKEFFCSAKESISLELFSSDINDEELNIIDNNNNNNNNDNNNNNNDKNNDNINDDDEDIKKEMDDNTDQNKEDVIMGEEPYKVNYEKAPDPTSLEKVPSVDIGCQTASLLYNSQPCIKDKLISCKFSLSEKTIVWQDNKQSVIFQISFDDIKYVKFAKLQNGISLDFQLKKSFTLKQENNYMMNNNKNISKQQQQQQQKIKKILNCGILEEEWTGFSNRVKETGILNEFACDEFIQQQHRLKWVEELGTFKVTMPFSEMLEKYINRDKLSDSYKDFLIQSFIDNQNEENINPKDLEAIKTISQCKTYPLYSFYLIMKLTNLYNDEIKDIFEFIDPLKEYLIQLDSLKLNKSLSNIFETFLRRCLDSKVGGDFAGENKETFCLLLLSFFKCSSQEHFDPASPNSQIFLNILSFVDKCDMLESEVLMLTFKKLKSKKLFLDSYAYNFKLFNAINEGEEEQYKKHFTVFKSLLGFSVTPEDIATLIQMNEKFDNKITNAELLNRYELALLFISIDRSFRLWNGRVIYRLILQDSETFCKLFDGHDASTRETVISNIHSLLENDIKRQQLEMSKLLNLITNPNLKMIFTAKVISMIGDYKHNEEDKIFIFTHTESLFVDLQNLLASKFGLDDFYHISLYCPKPNIPVSPNLTKNIESLDIYTNIEDTFRKRNPNIVLSKESHPYYYEITVDIIRSYLHSRGNQPSVQALDRIPDNSQSTLLYLQLFSTFIQFILQNQGHLQIYASYGKLVSLNISSNHWLQERSFYQQKVNEFMKLVEHNVHSIIKKFNPVFITDYDNQSSIIIKYFNAHDIPTSETLHAKYRAEVSELRSLKKVGEWLNKAYGFSIQNLSVDTSDIPPMDQIISLKKDIMTAQGSKGHYIQMEESIKFVRYFLSTEYKKIFHEIMSHYDGTEQTKQIDVICAKTNEFMKLLLSQNEKIELNNIFRRINSMTHQIDFKNEMQQMYSYFYPEKPFNNKENSLFEFINKATSLFGIHSNIHHLFNFINTNQNYILINDITATIDAIKLHLESVAIGQKKLMSVAESQTIFREITKQIGGLTYQQLVYFKYVNPDLIEFFSTFKDFQTTNTIMTANLITDDYNSSLINNTIHSYNQLKPFITKFQEKTDQKEIQPFKSLSEMCQSVASLMSNSKIDISSSLAQIEYVVNHLAHVRGIYSSAGGTYNIESILPTVREILKGAEFSTRSTKYEEGTVGWSVKIASNSVEFTQEKIEDFVQGLNITTTTNDHPTKELVAEFKSIVTLLLGIHKIHLELDREFHPQFYRGLISIPFSSANNTLEKHRNDLQVSLQLWKKTILDLPPRLWLLKAHGLSSLISGYNKRIKSSDPVNKLVAHITPYIKYCFPLANSFKNEVITPVVERVIAAEQKLDEARSFDILKSIIEAVEGLPAAYEEMNDETGPMLVNLSNKENLYNVLMQLNNSMLPHPSQLFYSYTFAKDIDYFFNLIQNMSGYTFFLIGIPAEKDRLIQWLSDHYSKQTTNQLARLYIISTERSMASELFSFLPQTNIMFDTDWKNFKTVWELSKQSIGVESLVLVCGESGTGKSYFIKSKKNNNYLITVHLRPNFDAKSMINYLIKYRDKKKVMIHFVISPYCDFDSFNHFIYPLITRGYVFGNRVEEIYNIPENFSVQIYVEIGSPLLGAKKTYTKFSDYLSDTIPLVQHLADISDHSKTLWEVTTTELKCYSYVHSNPYQKPSLELGRRVGSVQEYIEYIKKILLKRFTYNPAFLSSPKHLLHRKCFMKLLEERLNFLDAYYDTYAEIGLMDSESDKTAKDQQKLLQPYELYEYLILEAVKFADPGLASAQNIWKEPPMITSRYNAIQGNKKMVTINYIDFSTKPKLIDRVDLITLETAKKNPGLFRSIIANIFGIGSRTQIILNLCQQYNYVLTPEFGIRLLMLHNKVNNQRSLVLTGDTGVGKTFILLFYSLLINAKNNSLPDIINRIKEEVNKLISNKPDFILKGIFDGDQQVRTLPNEVHLNQVLDALTQLCDHDPVKDSSASSMTSQTSSMTSSMMSSNAGRVHNKGFQQTLFSTIENLIATMMANYPLIETPRNSILYQIRFKSSTSVIIQNKEKLLAAVKEIASATFRNLFHRIIMHQKFTSKIFKTMVIGYITEAKQLRHIDPNLKMVIFIDEFNTSPNDTLALINEIFIDGTLDGEGIIPDNIFWIAAMNPVKIISDKEMNPANSVDYTGTTASKLAFVVQQPPPSMAQLFLSYGEFTTKNEQSFLESLFAIRDDICPPAASNDLKEIIIIAQNALREANQIRTHVSIRDITRVIDLYKFFRWTDVGKSILNCSHNLENDNGNFIHWLSIVASIGLTHYIRVSPGENRDHLVKKIDSFYQKSNIPDIKHVFPDFKNMFTAIYSKFCETAKLPPGIALTESLKLNIFCTAVAINCRLPICIVGPPGCSKTLSFSIVMNNMNANKLDNPDSPWSHMTTADPFRYQCTPHTTDIEISSVFERSLNRQKTYDLSGGKSRCIVFFDEAGLVNENDSPMKIMHDYLDKVSQKMDKNSVDISVVILSNKVLDAAKTNRMLMLVHPQFITKEDERALATGCLYNNKVLTPTEDLICDALCVAYKKANTYAKSTKPDLFHQRDFVYFLRHLARGISKNMNVFNGEVLIESIERNFGGIPPEDFKNLALEFFKQLEKVPGINVKAGNLLDTDRTIKRIKQSLKEKLDTKEDPNSVPFRYIMVIDPTENESSLMILKELNIDATVIRVGGFERDSTTEALVNVVSQVKSKMTSGGTVVLVNTHQIDACFYDVFNRYFTLLPTPDGTMNFIANVSFGTHSIFCPVHPDFKIIVHLPLSQMSQTQLPWLNRFEKYQLSINKMLDYHIKKNLGEYQNYFTTLKDSAKSFVDEFHYKITNKSLLSGFSESETIPSLIYSIAKGMKPKDSFTITPQRINMKSLPSDSENFEVRRFNWKLLQIARPESIFNCKTLPQSYIEEYLLRQEHFNILRFLDHIFKQKFVDKDESIPNKWTFFTRTSLTLHRLKDSEHMDSFHKILLSQVFNFAGGKDAMKIDQTENILKILQLGSFKSSQACNQELEQFKESNQKICMVIADMSTSNQHQINFIVEKFSKFDNSKLLITICHYPPEFSLSNETKLNSIFLNGMEYVYVDSLGLKIDTQLMEDEKRTLDSDIRSWISRAYGIDVIDKYQLADTFKSMFFDHLRQVAREMNPVGLPPDPTKEEKEFYGNVDKRVPLIEELFTNNDTWYKTTIEMLCSEWSKRDMFKQIISNISKLIVSGKLAHSFFDSIKNSMTTFFYPMVAQIFKIVTNYHSYGRVSKIVNNSSNSELVRLFIQSVKVPEINENIEERFEPVSLYTHQEKVLKLPSELPLYDSIIATLKVLFEQTLSLYPNRGIEKVFTEFDKHVSKHPIGPLVDYITSKDDLYKQFQTDYIIRTMRFDKAWLDFIILVIKKIFPVQSNSILTFIVCNYFYSATIHYLKSLSTPLMKLNTIKKSILESFQGFDKEKLINSNQAKAAITTLSMNKIYAMVRNNYDDSDNASEFTSNWCTVVREILNRVPITTILRQVKGEAGANTAYIYLLFNICMTISTYDNPDITEKSLKCLYNAFSKFKGIFKPEDIISTYCSYYNSTNNALRAVGLPVIEVSCILSAIEPYINLSAENKKNFFYLALKEKLNVERNEFKSDIPMGWFCNIIYNNYDSFFKSYTQIIEDIYSKELYVNEVVPISNPVLLCLTPNYEVPHPTILTFLGVTEAEYKNDIKQNSQLVNILYFVELERCRRLNPNTNDLIVKWNKILTDRSLIERIRVAAWATHFIDQLAKMLNDEGVEKTMTFLENNNTFTQCLNKLFNLSNCTRIIKISKRYNHMYLLNKISSEKTLVEILKNQAFLQILGMEANYVALDISMKESTLYGFTIDQSTEDGQFFKSIKDAVDAKSDEAINRLANQARNNPRSCGFIRMSMLLITYQYYLDDLDSSFIDKIISSGSQFNNLVGNEPFVLYFKKIINKKFNNRIKNFDEVIMKYPNKAKDHYVIGQLLVNYLAASIGSSNNSYLYELTRDYKKVCGKLFPATELIFRDCGMVYRVGAPDARIYCMKNNPLYKYMIGSTSWGVFSWTASLTSKDDIAYLTDNKIHFANFLENKTVDGLTDYVGIRALTSISEVKINPDIAEQHVEPGHFLSELVYHIWDESYRAPRPCMKSTFASDKEVYDYEDYLIEVIEKVRRDYPTIKSKRIDAVVSQSPVLAQIIKCRQIYTTKFTSPFYDFEYIHDLITKRDSKLLLYFSTNIATICISKYFADIIKLLEMIFQHFARRLPKDFEYKTIPECIKYLEDKNYEDPNTLLAIRRKWDQAKKSWTEILEHLQIMEGGCRAMPEYEKVVEQINDFTPFNTLIFCRDLSSNGLIIKLINHWMSSTQSKAIRELEQVPKSHLFQQIINSSESDEKIDIGNISFEYGENFYLIGSNYNLVDFQKFVSNLVSQYQTFDRSSFNPKMQMIENKLIYNFVAGKINGGEQMSKYIVDFPYTLTDIPSATTTNNITSNASSLVPEYVKQLINVNEKLNSSFNQPLLDQNTKIPLDMSISKLHPEESELLCRFMTSLISRVLNNKPLIEGNPKLYMNLTFLVLSLKLGPLDQKNIPKSILGHLNSVTTVSLRSVTDIIIKHTLGYGHLYSGIVQEPVNPDPVIINNFEADCVAIKEESTQDGENIISWILYFEEIIQVLASPQSKEFLKDQGIGSSLSEVICSHLLKTMKNKSPSQKYPTLKDFFKKEIPLSYYSYFMRTIHEILSFLKIKDQDLKKEVYVEPYLYHFITKETSQTDKSTGSDVEMDDDLNERKTNDDDEDSYVASDDDGIDEDHGDIPIKNNVEVEYDVPRNVKSINFCHTGFQSLFNWLFYIKENLKLGNFIGNPNDKHLNDFISSTKDLWESYKYNNLVDVDEFLSIYFRFTETHSNTYSDLLVLILKAFNTLDPKMIPYNIYNMEQIKCPSCNNVLDKPAYIRHTFSIDSEIVTLESIIRQSSLFTCGTCKINTYIPDKHSEYIFIDIDRSLIIQQKLYNQLEVPNTFDLASILDIQGYNLGYSIHSILVHEPTVGSNDNLFSLIIKKNDKFYKITNLDKYSTDIKEVDLLEYKEIISKNCISLIYSNSYGFGKSTAQTTSPASKPADTADTKPADTAHTKPADTAHTKPETQDVPMTPTDATQNDESSNQLKVNDTFLDWVMTIGLREQTKISLRDALSKNGIDSFYIALSLLNNKEDPNMFRNILTGFTNIALNTFFNNLNNKIQSESFKFEPIVPSKELYMDEDNFTNWIKKIGFNSSSTDGIIKTLNESDVINFNIALDNLNEIKNLDLPVGNIQHLLTHLETLKLE